jgi:tetrahydromethanopterin S-methyltransferase subunit F
LIRGVNKNIIEISDTGNECFERAILFVRSGQGEGDLTAKAKRYLTGLRYRQGLFGRNRLILPATILLSALGGAGAAAIFLVLLL